ncbi:hypothetical protein FACS1894124_5100 [Spirochaetia bacterium]|nr:hypothetical protein FACS1894124_5100 [Spirochaetia bacterium]
MNDKTGGSAFPGIAGIEVIASVNKYGVQEIGTVEKPIYSIGMTLRDYFAGCALIGLGSGTNGDYADHLAKMAYVTADAMLAERNTEAQQCQN